MSQLGLLCRESHIDNLRRHLRFSDGSLDFRPAFFQELLDLRPGFIYHLSHLRAFLGRHIPHGFQKIGKFSLLAQDAHPDLVQFVGGVTIVKL